MKTVRNILAILVIALTMSCETHYRMITTLERNGQVHREIYAFENSPSMEEHSNSFLFYLSPDWNITRFNTIINHNFFGKERKFNVKISKDATSIEQYSQDVQYDNDKQSFAAPEESVSKKFGWFYTNYSFKAVYKKLKYEVPVPIANYLNKEEQILWTQGDMNNYKAFNGSEMSDYLNEISDKFFEWCSINYFEISLECIKKLTTGYDFDTDKENIYQEIRKAKIEDMDINPETVCKILDSFYKTKYFSELNKANGEILENDFETAISIINHVGNVISYELVIPKNLLKTNAPIIHYDTLIWKVDGMRLLFDDYSLLAEYRVANIWAFILSSLILIVAVGSLLWRKIKWR